MLDKVHISWPDADDLLSNALEFDNEVEGPWPLGRRAALQIRCLLPSYHGEIVKRVPS